MQWLSLTPVCSPIFDTILVYVLTETKPYRTNQTKEITTNLQKVQEYIGHFLHDRPCLALRKELLPEIFAGCRVVL